MKQLTRQRRWLLVLPHPALHRHVADTLQLDSLRLHEVATTQLLLQAVWQNPPDLLVLEACEQHMAIATCCRQLRTYFQFPILVVEQGASEGERIALLEQGADDVVSYDRGIADLLARCNALYRRVERQLRRDPAAHYMRVRDIALDIAGRRLLFPKAQLNLTLPMTRLLALLFSSPGTFIPRQELIQHVFGDVTPYTDIRFSTLMKTLRRRIEQSYQDAPVVVNVKGHGYRIALTNPYEQ
ncbi:MAG: winged helix-turn-helix domain-containing protein [Chloroflexaceae bacterium]|jgi:DNA-binding response OmpR family regulator|nr:winged helix-turn-helix domain-containing protein [Chloroflexaceae bacterium]